MNTRFMSLALPLAFTLAGSMLSASTIPECSSCQGAQYSLTYSGSPISSTATTQTFQITFGVNDKLFSNKNTYLNAVAIKVAAPVNLISASLVSGPSTFSYQGAESLSANGCGNGNDSFLGVESWGKGPSVTAGPFNFVYDVTVKKGTLFTGWDAASIKALYIDDCYKVICLTSDPITLGTVTPEPSSYLLFGSGLLALGVGVVRRKKIA